jgi:putative hydrolase of HD superfamily
MKNILNFLIEVSKLKRIPRTGWVWLGVKEPETIAEHTFRMAIAAWVLAYNKNLRIDKIIKTALFHDICEVYAGDITPYFGLLPEDEKKRYEVLKRWVRLPRKEKEKRAKEKFKIEKSSLLKLIKNLDIKPKEEILTSWLDFEKRISREGRFVKQVDKIETMLQAIEYFGTGEDTPVIGWWEEVEELVEDPDLLKFLKVIEKKIYRKPRKIEDSKELEGILDFILKVGKLKGKKRKELIFGWTGDFDTVANHTFMLTLSALIFSKKLDLKLDEKKLLKMALSHELSEVYSKEKTLFPFWYKKENENFNKWIRLSKKEKKARFIKDYKRKKRALKKLVKCLPKTLRKEIIDLWENFKTCKSKEGNFLSQVYAIETLLEALQRWKENKKFPIHPLWEWTLEIVDQPQLLEFCEIMKERFMN